MVTEADRILGEEARECFHRVLGHADHLLHVFHEDCAARAELEVRALGIDHDANLVRGCVVAEVEEVRETRSVLEVEAELRAHAERHRRHGLDHSALRWRGCGRDYHGLREIRENLREASAEVRGDLRGGIHEYDARVGDVVPELAERREAAPCEFEARGPVELRGRSEYCVERSEERARANQEVERHVQTRDLADLEREICGDRAALRLVHARDANVLADPGLVREPQRPAARTRHRIGQLVSALLSRSLCAGGLLDLPQTLRACAGRECGGRQRLRVAGRGCRDVCARVAVEEVAVESIVVAREVLRVPVQIERHERGARDAIGARECRDASGDQ